MFGIFLYETGNADRNNSQVRLNSGHEGLLALYSRIFRVTLG